MRGGDRIQEFRRPIYTGTAVQVSEPFIPTSMKIFSKNAFFGQAGGDLRCDTLSNLWWSPNFRNEFFQLPVGAWENNGVFKPGDDGGPLLKYAPGLARQWDGAGGVTDVAMYGAVLGVLQGTTTWCDYIQNATCTLPMAWRRGSKEWAIGSAVFPAPNIPQIASWMTFGNYFIAGVGNRDDLTANAQNSYTFPAYAGRIVGVAVNSRQIRYTPGTTMAS
jgi:hypothetical protein